MLLLHESEHCSRRLRVAVTERSDGDVHPIRVNPRTLSDRQRTLTGTRWAMAEQVHGVATWNADTVRPADGLAVADIVVAQPAARGPDAIAMWAADCATGVIVTEDRLVGFHAGWRGLAGGVVQRAVSVALEAGGEIETVVTGPVIGPCCYEFSEGDLQRVARGVEASPDDVRGTTADGLTALDVPAALTAALDASGAATATRAATEGCTGCDDRWFSHRMRLDAGRHALVGWVA